MKPRTLQIACTLAVGGSLLTGALNVLATGPALTAPPSASVSPGLPASITGELPRQPAPAKPAAEPAGEDTSAPTPHAGAETAAPAPVAPTDKARPDLDPQSMARQAVSDQLAALLHLAQRAEAKGDAPAAEQDFKKLLSLPAPAADKRAALGQMAAFYKERKMSAKAAVVYEKILALFPNDPENPARYLELGRIYRDAGLYDLAISRFYSVLNTAISQNAEKEGTHTTRNLSLLAQFEIAEASYAKGDYAAAAKFYARLQLLELPAADRPTVAFKNAQSLFQLGDQKAAAAALRGFIDTFPASPFTPEARNLLARSFQKLKRPEDATDAVLALLRQEKQANDPANLARWQRETGRQVATRFYEDGDFRSALAIYQTLATLDAKPDWQWPIVYQIGLCFERLSLPERAREAYGFLQRPQAGHDDPDEDKLPPALDAIRGMAKWRQEHLAWEQNSGAQLQALLGPQRRNAEALPDDAPPADAPAGPAKAHLPPTPASGATPPPLGTAPALSSAKPAAKSSPADVKAR